jgi:hypothetical protein
VSQKLKATPPAGGHDLRDQKKLERFDPTSTQNPTERQDLSGADDDRPQPQLRAVMNGKKRRYPTRKRAETFEIDANGSHFTASVGRFENGALAELLFSNGEPGWRRLIGRQGLLRAARDSVALASTALQYDVPDEVLRSALMRSLRSNGRAQS